MFTAICNYFKNTKLITVVMVLVFIFLQYRLLFADDGLIHAFRLKKEINTQRARNAEILKRNEALIADIDLLKKGGDAIENRARNDLGMVKKGEVFFQVVK